MARDKEEEKSKLAAFLRRVDKMYYHRIIENKQRAAAIFPYENDTNNLLSDELEHEEQSNKH